SLAVALGNLPQALVVLGQAEDAARLMAFAARFWERSIGSPSADDVASVKDVRKHVRKCLGTARTATLWAQGEALTLAQAVALALASDTASAISATAQGRPERRCSGGPIPTGTD